MKFKDFQAPFLFSSTFKALNLGEKKFKAFHGCVGTQLLSSQYESESTRDRVQIFNHTAHLPRTTAFVSRCQLAFVNMQQACNWGLFGVLRTLLNSNRSNCSSNLKVTVQSCLFTFSQLFRFSHASKRTYRCFTFKNISQTTIWKGANSLPCSRVHYEQTQAVPGLYWWKTISAKLQRFSVLCPVNQLDTG